MKLDNFYASIVYCSFVNPSQLNMTACVGCHCQWWRLQYRPWLQHM